MSDATSISSILTQRISTSKTADKVDNLRIVEVPKSIDTSKQSKNISGKVTQKESNGTIHIKTVEGDIKVKAEQRIYIKKGDNIDIRIEKGNPPITATLVKTTSRSEVQVSTQNLTPTLPDAVYPKNISAQKLAELPLIKVELLTPQLAQKITIPYIEIINSNLNLIPNLSALQGSNIGELSPQQNLLTAEVKLTNTIENILPPTISVEKNENISAFFKLDKPITEIPLRVIIEQSIASPISQPIKINAQSLETPAPSIFTEISIKAINEPIVQIQYGYSQENSEKHAGKIRSELVGFTKDKNLPVLKILLSQINNETKIEQHYALQVPVDDLIIGSQIELSSITSINTINLPSNAPVANTLQANPIPLPILGQSFYLTPEIWSVMQEVTQVLAQANPVVAQAFNNIIPSPSSPAQLGGAALFFLAAMRSGDVQSWLGDKIIDTLKRAGKAELINRLGAEFSTLSRMNSDATQEWRSLSMPLAWQNEIHKMVVHYRNENNSNNDYEQNSGNKTRFLLDLNLSNMGKVQLDGLFIGRDNRLELILRTEQGFSEAMKMEMRHKYKNALDDISYSGELLFQDKEDQWVNVTLSAQSEFLEDV